ncbi:MAG: hypothetical protein DRH04_01940 [Deltaproteobacteria bacterium]|nr:MAG: hypothetical protein DRH04_01940 [Deltaproteobacteria bacterium]
MSTYESERQKEIQEFAQRIHAAVHPQCLDRLLQIRAEWFSKPSRGPRGWELILGAALGLKGKKTKEK